MGDGEIRLDGQAALVTGAGQGVGRATALALAERGARLIVNDANGEAAESVSEEIRTAGGTAFAESSAVGSVEAARCMIDTAVERFGRLDILVNNAGISRPGAFGSESDADIDLVFEVNLLGPYRLMRAAWPVMRKQGYGRILNTASSAALGSGISGAYAPTKAGIIGLTKEAAVSGKPLGIKVNALMPSAYTPLLLKHPDADFRNWMEVHFRPEQVAALSVYLVSAENEASGEVFTSGGGLVSRLAFLQSKGIAEPGITPEMVAAKFETICRMAPGGSILSKQEDLQTLYFLAYPLDQ